MNRNTRKALTAECRVLQQRMIGELHELEGEDVRREYAFALLVRLLFAYFLQQQGLLDGNPRYLQSQLERCRNVNQPFSLFLATLAHWGLGVPAQERPFFATQFFGTIPYLSGDLFLPHPVELGRTGRGEWAIPELPNSLFEEALAAFQRFTWTLAEADAASAMDGGPEGIVTSAFLGALAENQVENRKKTGSFYMPAPICSYIVRQTCEPAILQRFEQITGRACASVEQLIETASASDCALLLFVVLPTQSICDPAVGAGDFLVAALDRMADIYAGVMERAAALRHPVLEGWMQDFVDNHPGRAFGLKKRVLCRNLFGVDIQQPPLDVSRLRLSLDALSSVTQPGGNIALANLAYALRRGNSLIGVERITEKEEAQLARIHPGYRKLVATRNALVRCYRESLGNPVRLAALRADIDALRRAAYESLNRVLLERLIEHGAKIEVAGEPADRSRSNRQKRDFTIEDIRAFDPFHWAFDFEEVMSGPWWNRLDGDEAQVSEVNGRMRVRFGPERERSHA
jgi:hypothetical protein